MAEFFFFGGFSGQVLDLLVVVGYNGLHIRHTAIAEFQIVFVE